LQGGSSEESTAKDRAMFKKCGSDNSSVATQSEMDFPFSQITMGTSYRRAEPLRMDTEFVLAISPLPERQPEALKALCVPVSADS
jgi:hypothetical protein